MKYKIRTKVDNGVTKIAVQSNPKDKRKTFYIVIDENNQEHQVDKNWIITNIDKIENIGISGNSLYLKGSKTKKEFVKEDIKFLYPTVYDVLEAQLPKILEKYGVPNINFVTFSRGATYPTPEYLNFRIKVEENAYKFEKGYLAICCAILSKEESHNVNAQIAISISLDNMETQNINYVNGGSHTSYNHIKRLVEPKIFKLVDIPSCVNPRDYDVRHNPFSGWDRGQLKEAYPGNLYSYTENGWGRYMDSSYGDKCVKQAVKALDKYIKDNIEAIKKYLYLPEGYVENKPIELPYEVVEKEGYWVFPSARGSRKKAYELEKKGYKIVVNDVEMTAKAFDEKCEKELKTSGSCAVRFYNSVSEYIDKKKKIFYCKLGAVRFEDLWC